MTHQRIRIRTDIFKSQQFALLEDRTDVVPLFPLSPVPSILNDKFNHIDELEVVCLGNGKNWDYNDNLSSKDLSNPNVTDILGEEPLHTGKANLISDAKYIQDTTKRIQNMKNWLLKQQDYGTSIQISKQIVEDEKSLEEAKMRFHPALEEWLRLKRLKSSLRRSVQPCLNNERIESIDGGNFSDAKYILDTRRTQEEIQAAYEEWPKTESTSTENVKSTKTLSASTSTLQSKINESTETARKPVTFTKERIDVVEGGYFCSICQIKLNKGSLVSHLEGKRHAKIAKQAREAKVIKLDEEYKHKIASKNEISSREFIVITETNDGEMKQVCSLCDAVVPSEKWIQSHLSGQKHKSKYGRYRKEFESK